MSRPRACTEQQFLNDITKHEMRVLRDDGLFRMIVFKQPETINMMFSLITWPGSLCISGDMGCFVFSRLNDMFHFFRQDQKEGKGLYINLPYWSEKLDAVDKTVKVKEYSYDLFKQIVQERIDEAETSKAQRDAVELLVGRLEGQPIEAVHEHMRYFEDFDFYDFWEHDLTEYTYHFVWCCYAIAWGIQQYDKLKAEMPPVGVTS